MRGGSYALNVMCENARDFRPRLFFENSGGFFLDKVRTFQHQPRPVPSLDPLKSTKNIACVE